MFPTGPLRGRKPAAVTPLSLQAPADLVRLKINCISFQNVAFAAVLLSASMLMGISVQVDTMEMMRHPGETTNMRRQTVASYFRVCLLFVFSLLTLFLVIKLK